MKENPKRTQEKLKRRSLKGGNETHSLIIEEQPYRTQGHIRRKNPREGKSRSTFICKSTHPSPAEREPGGGNATLGAQIPNFGGKVQ